MKRRFHQILLGSCLLIVLLSSSCNRPDFKESDTDISEFGGNNKAHSKTMDPKSVSPKEPERMIFVYQDDSGDNGHEIRLIVWQEEQFSRLTDEQKRCLWEGLMYELDGSGSYYEFMIQYAPKHGKIWKRPEDSKMDYPNWFLDDLEDDSKAGRVTISPSKDGKIYLSVGAASHLRVFVREPSDSTIPDPFAWMNDKKE